VEKFFNEEIFGMSETNPTTQKEMSEGKNFSSYFQITGILSFR
jgi:hypothetical protein